MGGYDKVKQVQKALTVISAESFASVCLSVLPSFWREESFQSVSWASSQRRHDEEKALPKREQGKI